MGWFKYLGMFLWGGVVINVALAGPLDKDTRMWQWVEWDIGDVSYSGNPFDVEAQVEFNHEESERTIKTDMFYEGDNTWKFRFTGVREGNWVFTSSSLNEKLNGLSGSVNVRERNSELRGFITGHGNKFAIMSEDENTLDPFLWDVYQIDNGGKICNLYPFRNNTKENVLKYADLAEKNGMNGLFFTLANQWFKLGALRSDEHDSVNPDLETFVLLDTIISVLHRRGMFAHFWKWGDNQRKWNQVDVGGINGVPDKRLQRYISARLAPLPGWSMDYGFDLAEWAKKDEDLNEWAGFMQEKMGWQHLLSVRSFQVEQGVPGIINGYAITDREKGDFYQLDGFPSVDKVIADLNQDKNRPHAYVERHALNRYTDAIETRKLRWRMAFAGGMGGWWGVPFNSDPVFGNGSGYPNSDELKNIRIFMLDKNRFRLDMEPDKSITDGIALKNEESTLYLFYREEASSVKMDLSGMSNKSQAFAIDARKPYAELKLGELDTKNQTWQAPEKSDWVIAVGEFGEPTTSLQGRSEASSNQKKACESCMLPLFGNVEMGESARKVNGILYYR